MKFALPRTGHPRPVIELIQRIEGYFEDVAWPRVKQVADEAALPPAQRWPNRLCRLADTGQVVISNGTAWTDMDGSTL